MKSLKEVVKDRLFKQDQSLQTVHMLCRPKPYYNELHKVVISYKNPLCLTRAKQDQPALYNGHEIIKDNYFSTIVHNTKDTLEIAKITRKKMNDKMKDPECVTHKVRIAPHDYSKENFLDTFTPQKKLNPEQMVSRSHQDENKSSKRADHSLQTNQSVDDALTKEIKEMKDVFEELEAKVAQNVVDRKHDEIERKKLLIENDNLVAECLSKEVFSVATNSELNVARFTEMHVANTIVEAYFLELEAELSNLLDKSHNDNHDELVNHFSNLEVHHLNLQLMYQNLKDSFRNYPPTPDKDTPDFDSVFVIDKMQASLQGKDNITQLTTKVTALQAQNDLFRAENDKIKQQYEELYDSIKITRTKHIEQVTALTTKNVNLNAQILNTMNSVSKDHVKPKVLAPRKYAIDVEPIVPHLRNNREAHLDYLRHLKESVETIHDIVEEAKVVRPLDSSIVSACRHTKHSQELLEYATGVNRCTDASRSQPRRNTRKNRISSAKVIFGNDHFGAIMGYGDYVIGDSVISRVYYVEGLGDNLFFIRQCCDSDLEFAFRKHSCYVRDTDGVELIKGSRSEDLGKLQPTADIRIFVGYEPSRKGPAPIFLTHGQISSGLVPNPVPAAPYVPS
nr:integrase, catalytic region, zinc finger, CCHC-type, peptidase aspartic, catalytic [Tanacetum cinerariifolium]